MFHGWLNGPSMSELRFIPDGAVQVFENEKAVVIVHTQRLPAIEHSAVLGVPIVHYPATIGEMHDWMAINRGMIARFGFKEIESEISFVGGPKSESIGTKSNAEIFGNYPSKVQCVIMYLVHPEREVAQTVRGQCSHGSMTATFEDTKYLENLM
jgi:hypothetical protein